MTTTRTDEDILPVLIVGAGPTGLTLACQLARSGISFRLIEKSTSVQRGSRGKGLQPRSLEAFDQLGMVDRVLANGQMAMPVRKIGRDGQVVVSGAEPIDARPDVPYPANLITPEWRVEEALRMRLGELGGNVEFDTALDHFEQMDDMVTVAVVRGKKVERVIARWLVGCDGGHSIVRKQAGIPFEGETREEVRMIVADVSVDGLNRDAWHMWSHQEGLVALCPLPSTNAYQFQAGIAPEQNPELSLQNMQSILQVRSGRSDIRLRDAGWMSLWRANIRLAVRYHEGRVFLAGDAAHIHSPAGGQGMNTGIQDACNLGWKLAAVLNGAGPALLESYEAERRPVAVSVLALSDARLKQTLEQNNIPTNRDAITTQLGISYRGSFLARDDRDQSASLRAGDRAPDATKLITLKGECRLFELLRDGHFTLLNFGPAVAVEAFPFTVTILNVVQQPRARNDVADSAGHLAKAFLAKDGTLVLIRPDGYIGLISDAGTISSVPDYFTLIR